MNKPYILAVDQSTSATKALILDQKGEILGRYALEHTQYYPQPGWVEHDPLEIYRNVLDAVRAVLQMKHILPDQLSAVTITNQRETVVVWDKETGRPVYNAIVWQCRRTADSCSKLKADGYEPMVRDKTGLILDPYFSAAKIRWILDRLEPDYRHDAAAGGRLLAGTIDSWLVWKLTNGGVFATDYTNASRTSLFNIHTLQWDPELVRLFGVEEVALPEVKSSNGVYGYTETGELFAERVPISGIIGDSQAALYGQLCHLPGTAKATYGTGTSVLMNIGNNPVKQVGGLVTAIAWGIDGKVEYALEGIIHSTGDCLKWVKDQLGLFKDFAEAEQSAASLQDNEGVYMVPAFVGLGAPYWDANARAAILGMSRRTGKPHIIRAALESIAYQVCDIADLMEAESGIRLKQLRVDGGAADNRFLMQFQADLLQAEVLKRPSTEFSAIGSALLGGMGVGFWQNGNGPQSIYRDEACYRPHMDAAVRERYYEGWKAAVGSVIHNRSTVSGTF